MVTKVKCPTCQKEIEWGPQSPFRPFCSKRCQLIDLGEWASEEKRIPGTQADVPPDFGDDEWQ
ncbi:DNA gyrase inhibitor YacG [Aeromonas simiae]|nr:DNA gyrase inhibitor YacG [Aeromonas simiae]MDO2948249.1 DNA gyrase inhibitor YacG [Aeromonas simiae]MDO2951730.1 DNA gyrase inhibitor YacG [Aeromonas simiae]MDO2955562.1 DNA gyrase inhibitor YacG [Aeromonas simiae]